MNTRRHPRTLAEAFGPYTSHDLQPMKDQRQRETSGAEIAAYILALVAIMLIVHFTNR